MNFPGANSLAFLMTAAVVALAFFSLAAWAYFRGRRVPLPPSCRKCGYDVSQRPTDTTRCSECGADLTLSRAIATHRHRPRRWAVVPLVLSIGAIGVCVNAGRSIVWRKVYIAYAPTAWIASHAKSDFGRTGNDMRVEWIRRNVRQDELVAHLLELQAEPRKGTAARNTSWRWDFGRPIERAILDRLTSEEQKRSYFAHLLEQARFSVSAKVKEGESIPTELDIRSRAGSDVLLYESAMGIALDEDPALDFEKSREMGTLRSPIGGAHLSYGSQKWGVHPPTLGHHTLNVRYGFRLLHPETNAPISDWIEQAVSAPVEVVPISTVIATPVAVPKDRQEAVARAVQMVVHNMSVSPYGMLTIWFQRAEIDRAFEVVAVLRNGERVRCGQYCVRANESGSMNFVVVTPKSELGDSIDIELVGNADAANRGVNVTTYWPATIRYRNVPVTANDAVINTTLKTRTPTTLPVEITIHRTTQP